MSKHSKEIDALENFTGEARPSEETIAMGINPEGFSAMPVLRQLYLMFICVAVVIVATVYWIKAERQSAMEEVSLTSQPRELRQAEASASRKLTQYGQISPEEGVYRVPIDRAIDLMVEEEWKERDNSARQTIQATETADSLAATPEIP